MKNFKKMKPILKYPGGKEQELKYINSMLPEKINAYYEPFVGGGAVFFDIKAKENYINDKSEELIYFYSLTKKQNVDFIRLIKSFNKTWRNISDFCQRHKRSLVNIYQDGSEMASNLIKIFLKNNDDEIKKIYYKEFKNNFDLDKTLTKYLYGRYKTIKKIEKSKSNLSSEKDIYDNIVCAFKASYYVYLRHVYSNYNMYHLEKYHRAALYFFMREYCYSSMFRFNSNGEFNVPYGGISYNEKYLTNKIDMIISDEYKKKFRLTKICSGDFYDFLNENPPKKDDFIFIDPPYDTDFSTYDKNAFGSEDQKRLAEYLINECKGKFMLIIKKTPLISSLYKNNAKCRNNNLLRIDSFDKTYTVSFKNRNDKKCTHLMITNY